MSLRVSVTGAAGFLAAHLLRELRVALPDADLFGVTHAPPSDLVPGVDYMLDLSESDIVFHLAGAAGIERSIEDPMRDCQRNIAGTLAVLEASRRMRGVRLVLASSIAVYGQVEDVVSEEDPPHPISPYGVSKLAAEGYVRAYAHLHGVAGCIARIGNPYGPGQRKLAIYDLARRALREAPPLRLSGTGLEVRDFVHARDVGRALVAIALNGTAGETYNVGSGHGVTLREVANLVARAAGLSDDAVRADDAPLPGRVGAITPPLEKLTRLGYRPTIALERGIAETVAWTRSA